MLSLENEEKILSRMCQRLQILKERAAIKGYSAPPEMIIEIEEIEEKIKGSRGEMSSEQLKHFIQNVEQVIEIYQRLNHRQGTAEVTERPNGVKNIRLTGKSSWRRSEGGKTSFILYKSKKTKGPEITKKTGPSEEIRTG